MAAVRKQARFLVTQWPAGYHEDSGARLSAANSFKESIRDFCKRAEKRAEKALSEDRSGPFTSKTGA